MALGMASAISKTTGLVFRIILVESIKQCRAKDVHLRA